MKRAKWIYLTIIVVCLMVITVSTYFALGGFDKLEVFVFDGASRTVIGKEYIGSYKPSQIRDIVRDAKTMIDDGKLRGNLTVIEFQNDTIGADSSHYFIGSSFDEIRNVLEIPSGYSYYEFETSKIYRVFITMHPLVRPLPSDVRSMMEVRSIEEGDVLRPYTFDVYYQDGSWCTEACVAAPL